jgi:hypothetical protein
MFACDIVLISDSGAASWSNIVGESQIVGPFYDGSTDCGLMIPTNLMDIITCNINVVEMDQVCPHIHWCISKYMHVSLLTTLAALSCTHELHCLDLGIWLPAHEQFGSMCSFVFYWPFHHDSVQ